MTNPVVATRDYILHSVAELKKVAWPSRDMTIRYSSLVVAVSLALAAFFAALDFGLQQGVDIAFSHVPAAATPVSAPIPDVTPTLDTSGSNNNNGITVTPETSPSPTDVAPTPAPSGDVKLPPIEAPKK